MEYRVLAVGDVVGENGLRFLRRHLRSVKQQKGIHLTVVNGENISGVGLTPDQAEDLFAAGADLITLGNHTFNRPQIGSMLEENPYLLRPANYTGRVPGKGFAVWDAGAVRVGVMNLIGRCELDFHAENPFTTADRILAENRDLTFIIVDFHAEATSEKLAMGYYLDGRVAAVWGTHTHVPTADEQVLPGGTGYITDLGMTGPIRSVLGIRPEQSIETFLGGRPGRYQVAADPCKLQGAIFTLDTATGRCTAAERLEIR